MNSKITRPKKETLEDLYYNKLYTLQEIGEKYGVSRQRVSQWFIAEDIKLEGNTLRIERKYNSFNITKEQMSKYIKQQLSYNKIAKKEHQPKENVIRKVEELGLTDLYNSYQKVRFDITKIPTKEKLEEMYNTMSISAIKEELDCSQGTLYKWLAFYDIGKKDTKRKEQLPSKTQFLKAYKKYQTINKLSEELNCSTEKIYKCLLLYVDKSNNEQFYQTN